MSLFDEVQARAKQTAGQMAASAVARRHVPPGMASAARALGTNPQQPRIRPAGTPGNLRRLASPLLGGISLEDAQRIHAASASMRRAKKNQFIVELTDLMPMNSGLVEGSGPYTFNFFALDVGYSAHVLVGEKRRVGGANIDGLMGLDSVEVRITTYDDTLGTLKRWFKAKVAATAHRDGTVGVPADYLVKIAISHAVVVGAEDGAAFRDEFLMRATSLEHDLSRRDDAMAELQMMFTQADTQVIP
jgi:hypothetical protein